MHGLGWLLYNFPFVLGLAMGPYSMVSMLASPSTLGDAKRSTMRRLPTRQSPVDTTTTELPEKQVLTRLLYLHSFLVYCQIFRLT
jgi:hypothetical protein